MVMCAAATMWVGAAAVADAWAPLTVTGECSPDGTQQRWVVNSSQSESDLGVDYATNSSFSSYSSAPVSGANEP